MLNMDMQCAPFIEIFQRSEFTLCLPNMSRFICEIVSLLAERSLRLSLGLLRLSTGLLRL